MLRCVVCDVVVIVVCIVIVAISDMFVRARIVFSVVDTGTVIVIRAKIEVIVKLATLTHCITVIAHSVIHADTLSIVVVATSINIHIGSTDYANYKN